MKILLVRKNNEWSGFFPLLESTEEELRAELLALLSHDSNVSPKDTRSCEPVPNDILETCGIEEAVIIELLSTDISEPARFYKALYDELFVEYNKLLAVQKTHKGYQLLKAIFDEAYPTNGLGLVPK